MDFLMRASEEMGGVEPFVGEYAHFFRGAKLKDVAKGDRVYFVRRGADYGQPTGTGAVIAYATYEDYKPVYGEYASRDGRTATGTKDAYIIRGPWTPISPPVFFTDGFKGVWPARKIPAGLDQKLRNAAPA